MEPIHRRRVEHSNPWAMFDFTFDPKVCAGKRNLDQIAPLCTSTVTFSGPSPEHICFRILEWFCMSAAHHHDGLNIARIRQAKFSSPPSMDSLI